jgi:hypothetical protein
MNDEANTHYFSMLLQMMEGHQWLLNQLEFKPRCVLCVFLIGHPGILPHPFPVSPVLMNLLSDTIESELPTVPFNKQ